MFLQRNNLRWNISHVVNASKSQLASMKTVTLVASRRHTLQCLPHGSPMSEPSPGHHWFAHFKPEPNIVRIWHRIGGSSPCLPLSVKHRADSKELHEGQTVRDVLLVELCAHVLRKNHRFPHALRHHLSLHTLARCERPDVLKHVDDVGRRGQPENSQQIHARLCKSCVRGPGPRH